MYISNIRDGISKSVSFPNGNSTTTITLPSHSTGFIFMKALSDNDSAYLNLSFISRDDGIIFTSTIQSASFYDLSLSVSGSNNILTITITDGSGGGSTGGVLTIEAIYI